MTLPDVMRAVTIREPGTAYVLVLDGKYPVPLPGNGEVLIRMAAIAESGFRLLRHARNVALAKGRRPA